MNEDRPTSSVAHASTRGARRRTPASASSTATPTVESTPPPSMIRCVGPQSVTSCPNSRCQTSSSGKPTSANRSEEHTSELQSHVNLVCRLLLEKKKNEIRQHRTKTHAADDCTV